MMTLTKEQKRDIRIEMAARKIIKHKLETAIKALNSPIEKTLADREARKQQLSEYKNYYDLQDAYGWGFITEEEFDALTKALETGTDAIDNEITAQEIAQTMLKGWLKITLSDIADLEFQLLPEQKQREIIDRNYEIAMKRKERRGENK